MHTPNRRHSARTLNIALVQYAPKESDISHNTALAERLIREGKNSGADIVLFPECFLTGYAPPDVIRDLPPIERIENRDEFVKWCDSALEEGGEAIRRIARSAAENSVGVVITGLSKGERYPQNTAWIIDRRGKIILKYSKVHTCDFDWERYLEPGDSFPVCEFDGIRLGCMICYDREYPESARELMLGGAEFILHPNCCGSMAPRLRELSVRAMENMVGIAMANPPGPGMGCSACFSPVVWDEEGNPLDNAMFVAPELESGVFCIEFDVDQIRKYRKEEDIGKYRKPGAYRRLRR